MREFFHSARRSYARTPAGSVPYYCLNLGKRGAGHPSRGGASTVPPPQTSSDAGVMLTEDELATHESLLVRARAAAGLARSESGGAVNVGDLGDLGEREAHPAGWETGG